MGIALPNRARVAGSLALISLIIPWNLVIGNGYYVIEWNLFEFFNNGYNYTSYVSQWYSIFAIVRGLTFICVLSGAILLFARSNRPRLSSTILLVGSSLTILYWLYDYTQGISLNFSGYIPLGILLAFASAIVGFTAPSFVQKNMPNTQYSLDRLIKLKMLFDSGVITQADFDEEKKRFLITNVG